MEANGHSGCAGMAGTDTKIGNRGCLSSGLFVIGDER